MSAPAGTEALSQAANKRFISGVVEGEQTGPGPGNSNPELRRSSTDKCDWDYWVMLS